VQDAVNGVKKIRGPEKKDSILTSGGICSCSMETFSGYVAAVFKAVLTTLMEASRCAWIRIVILIVYVSTTVFYYTR